MILFHSEKKGQFTERLWQAVAAVATRPAVKRYRTLRGLKQALCRPGKRPEIVVLAVADEEELGKLLSIRELLWDLRIILALPNDDPTVAAMGHLLRPRFTTCGSGRIEEMVSVLDRIVEQITPGTTSGPWGQ